MSSLFAGEFRKDIIRAVFAAVVAASVLASAIAYAADMYFGDTVSGLIGEYGEYDLVLMVREDLADAALDQMREIVRERYPGVRLKKGITLSGRTNVLVGLPPGMRNAEAIQEFPVQFVNVPGYSGYGVMIEPRIEITGIDSEAVREMLLRRCEQVNGVLFVFEHHGNVAVVFEDASAVDQATETISKILESYTLIDVRFPISGQVDDLRAAENELANAVVERFGQRDVLTSSELKDEGMGDLTKALAEMKRFLTYYATSIHIEDAQRPLTVGEHVVLRPEGGQLQRTTGQAADCIAMVISAEESGYRAVVTEGDVEDGGLYSVYELQGTSGGSWLGNASANSELARLARSLDSGIELLGGLVDAADEAGQSARVARQLLADYGHLIASLTKVNQNVQTIESLIDSAANGLMYGSTSKQLVSALKSAKLLVDDFRSGLDAVSAVADTMSSGERFNGALERVTATLQHWQDSLSGYGEGLEAIASVLEDSGQAGEFLSQISHMTQAALEALYGLDIEGLSARLDGLISSLDSVRSVDTDAIHSQLMHIRESLPELRDEEVGRSIRLIDSYLGGQVIPGDRIQMVVSGKIPASAAKRMVETLFEDYEPATTVSSLGSIQPGVRTQVLRVLGEVRSTIAALVALVLTALILLFDHSCVISLLKRTDACRCVAGGKNVRMATVYSAALGAVIFSSIMALSRASIPLLGPTAVFLLGAGIGLCASLVAEKVSPVDFDEVMAGVAIGLPWHRIMRDIVIPAGRPGLLSALNRSEASF
ncbi:MAG: hypothetical protein GXX08_01320 [Firmicutes bacterium]|nr:hypothetical protein [Bacillota bacterium]